ncbi:MAG: gfo/Idh/MocA family oxidoreductase, partial [Candidatus Hydrogenedentes bacterium]|nr:gfo/Idh/MocA family oxidoreductase [Candidatus Hydrogenedentota bacterium]
QRGELPPVTLTWYQGNRRPPQFTDGTIPNAEEKWRDGVLFVGDKGMVISNYGIHALLPESQFVDFEAPEPFIPDSIGHHAEWIHACKTGAPTTCNFEYAGWLTEANHLGNVAYRAGKKLEWNPVTLSATNAPEAEPYIRRNPRAPWKL